ncbi:hypothetical protein Psyaliredsea_32010 [Psychrobacter alimentarius]
MLAKRIIPCLDVDNGRVVKGVQFVDIKDAGDPVEVAKRYNEQGADEITFWILLPPMMSVILRIIPLSAWLKPYLYR